MVTKTFLVKFTKEQVHIPENWETTIFSDPLNGAMKVPL